ncbi:hypothetical protein CTAYLR_000319 [Chrysophaeum taylorii]|uniref:Histidine kinase n=1 Tax=Chrysophaeum taylorii TaxID=2483200 RepID=A0AAD7UG86_9STRA|nr:hypothetical protein CTAYLR_000319 [Chrysophaeum taylorii]
MSSGCAAPSDRRYAYSTESLSALDLLEHPVWVFDIERRCMWWANMSALRLWDANSREELLSRPFDDMSEASLLRLTDYHRRFYPKGMATVTVNCSCSGILLDDGSRLAMLVEGTQVVREEIDRAALRSVEMLRHLRVAVGQFDLTGRVLEQNPQALDTFGPCDGPLSDFVSRFEDARAGKALLDELLATETAVVSFEARQKTIHDQTKWFAVDARRSVDPVTGDAVILSSARDVTERKEADANLERAKDDAEAANRAKSEFFAVVTHEIRTPLNGVIGFAELLAESNDLNVEQRDYIESLRDSALSLMSITNDLLDFSKLEAGRMVLENVGFELEGVVASALAVVRPKALEKGLELVASPDSPRVGQVVSDPNRLRQILLTLLSNSVKFTEAGRVVLAVSTPKDSNQADERNSKKTATTTTTTTRVRFSVEDTGIALANEDTELLFNSFPQTDASVARRFGGTALGLAISKILVEALGGQIGVDTALDHRGSRFWFEIPFLRPSSSTTILRVDDHPNAIPPKRHRAGRVLRVLVAEDNKVNQKLATLILDKLGHEHTVVENGKLAVDAVKRTSFDVVLMDMQMPEMDGDQATRLIRDLGFTKHQLPVIGLTADYSASDHQTYLDAGFNTCLPKPCRLENLRDVFTRFANSRAV